MKKKSRLRAAGGARCGDHGHEAEDHPLQEPEEHRLDRRAEEGDQGGDDGVARDPLDGGEERLSAKRHLPAGAIRWKTSRASSRCSAQLAAYPSHEAEAALCVGDAEPPPRRSRTASQVKSAIGRERRAR
jgi:hypothetical protein